MNPDGYPDAGTPKVGVQDWGVYAATKDSSGKITWTQWTYKQTQQTGFNIGSWLNAHALKPKGCDAIWIFQSDKIYSAGINAKSETF